MKECKIYAKFRKIGQKMVRRWTIILHGQEGKNIIFKGEGGRDTVFRIKYTPANVSPPELIKVVNKIQIKTKK